MIVRIDQGIFMLIEQYLKDTSKIKRIYLISNRYIGIATGLKIIDGSPTYKSWVYSDYKDCGKSGRQDLNKVDFRIRLDELHTKNKHIRNAIRMIKHNHPNIIKIPKKYHATLGLAAFVAYIEPY